MPAATHGASRGMNQRGYAALHPTYKSWLTMRRRCLDKNGPKFHLYGGRGIAIAFEWLDDYEAFYAALGDRPLGMTLDRIDPNGDYAPGNVRWATQRVQCRNARTTPRVSFNGMMMPVPDACELSGVNLSSLKTMASREKVPHQQVFDRLLARLAP